MAVALTVDLKGYVLSEQYKYGTCPHIEAYYALVFQIAVEFFC